MSKIVKLRNIKNAIRLGSNIKYGDVNDTESKVSYVIGGRIESIRPLRKFHFIDLIDGSTKEHLQVLIPKEILSKPRHGSYLVCQGRIVPSLGPQQAMEFKVDDVKYKSDCDPTDYPLRTDVPNLKDGWYRKTIHMRPRSSAFASLLRIRSEMELAIHMIMKQMDFFRVHTPIITSNDSEANCDLFELRHDSSDDYFTKRIFASTSAQLHLECLAASLSRVYSLSTSMRAEKSLSNIHLCEFLMLEAEESNVTEVDVLLDRTESIIKFVASYIRDVSEHKDDLSALLERNSSQQNFDKISSSPYVRITYKEAVDVLKKLQATVSHNDQEPLNYGHDLKRHHERMIVEYCDNVPVFITNYPEILKPFYMKCNEFKESLCFDLIAPIGGEICGGSLREDDLSTLNERIQDKENFEWYADLRKFGSFPHGGFGIGFDRLVQSLIGIRNIRDVTPFPRWASNITGQTKCDMWYQNETSDRVFLYCSEVASNWRQKINDFLNFQNKSIVIVGATVGVIVFLTLTAILFTETINIFGCGRLKSMPTASYLFRRSSADPIASGNGNILVRSISHVEFLDEPKGNVITELGKIDFTRNNGTGQLVLGHNCLRYVLSTSLTKDNVKFTSIHLEVSRDNSNVESSFDRICSVQFQIEFSLYLRYSCPGKQVLICNKYYKMRKVQAPLSKPVAIIVFDWLEIEFKFSARKIPGEFSCPAMTNACGHTISDPNYLVD